MLAAPLSDPLIKKSLIAMISDILDAELKLNGILPIQEKSPVDRPLSEDTGGK